MKRGRCPFSRRGHRWGGRGDMLRSNRFAAELRADPKLRICYDCGAPGRITSQGTTVEDPTMKPFLHLVQTLPPPPTSVKITPLAHRAKWAQKPTEFDPKPSEPKR